MRRGHGAGVNRDCEDAATSESFELPAVAASPGPAEGALATAMAKSPAARSEPITAFALIQRLNSRGSSEDQSRKMSRFSTTRLRLLRRPLIASRPAGEGEVVHRAERNKVQDRQTSGPKAGARSGCHRTPASRAKRLASCSPPSRDTAFTSEIACASKRARGGLSISSHLRHAIASSDAFCLKPLELARYDLR